MPHPLAHTGEHFARLAAGRARFPQADGRWIGGEAGAMEVYRSFYRDGPAGVGAGQVAPLGHWMPSVVHELREESPEGTVIKFLTRVPLMVVREDGTLLGPSSPAIAQGTDHLTVESVLIPMLGSSGRSTYTLCVSSQVGCAMGCTFCETAQMGLIRSLAPEEIVGQWYAARHLVQRVDAGTPAQPPPITNIVFMGMGEPLDNVENLVRAIAILKDHNGPHLSISKITVSTVGRVDGIEVLARQVREPGWHRLGIALSLNAPNDADRGAIMPINRRWNLAAVREALLAWPEYAGNKICVEYVLIPGVNDSRGHARQIAEFIAPFGLHKTAQGEGTNIGLRAVLNLIPYNPRRNSPWPAPSEDQVEEFMGWLVEEGVFVKRRRTKGRRMMGACGQLGSEHIRKRRVVQLSVGGSAVEDQGTADPA